MDKISDRRQARSGDQAKDFVDARQRWIVLGAGRLGRGFLNLVANELSYRSLLVVAGENTPQSAVDVFNDLRDRGEGYRIISSETPRQVQLINYTFMTTVDTHVLLSEIADANTRVISTSVGLDRLEQLAPIVAEGLLRRHANTNTAVLLLVCENGRSPQGLVPSETFRLELERRLEGIDLATTVIMPRVVVDCAVPSLPGPTGAISLSDGWLWVEELPEVRDLLGTSQHVRLRGFNEMVVLHTRKLYGYNSLHCILSVLGSFARERYVDVIARDPNLQAPLEHIVQALVTAVCLRHRDVLQGADREPIKDFCQSAWAKMQRPVAGEFDLVERALKKVVSGWYLWDGRVDGPVADLGLLERPWEWPQLVHALSLCLHCFVQHLDTLREALPWLPAGRPTGMDDGRAWLSILAPVVSEALLLHPTRAQEPLMEVLAEDARELSKWGGRRWSTERLAEFLNRPIDSTLRAVPRHVNVPRCVIFSLNGGVVNTESLLYLVTRDLVAQYSKEGRTISHDEYAHYVGVSERGFFEEMVREYQIRERTAEALVKERERLYLNRLSGLSPDSLVKPGLKDTLRLLARQRVKMAVCSNASTERVLATLEHVGLANYFVSSKSPSVSLREKPAPDMLYAILTEFNVDAINCIVVTSSLTTAEAARRAGCFCILMVNDYTSPEPMHRRGIEVLANAQALLNWFSVAFSSS